MSRFLCAIPQKVFRLKPGNCFHSAAALGFVFLALNMAWPVCDALCDAPLAKRGVKLYLNNAVTIEDIGNYCSGKCLTTEVISVPPGWSVVAAEDSDTFCPYIYGRGPYPYVTKYVDGIHPLTFMFSIRPGDNAPDGDIFWRMSGSYEDNGNICLCPCLVIQQPVKIVFPPASFSLSSPASGAVVDTLTPTFEWNPSNGAAYYQLNLYDDQVGSPAPTPFYKVTGMTGTACQYNGEPLFWGGKYWWEVIASNAWASTQNAEGRQRFDIIPTPEPGPFLISWPVSGGRYYPSPKVQWSASQNANYYVVLLYNDVNGSPASTYFQTSGQVFSQTWTPPAGSLTLGKYYWIHVNAFTAASKSRLASNGPVRFLVSQLENFSLYTPVAGDINVPVQPTFNWLTCTGAASYRIEIRGATSQTASFVFSGTTTQTSYTYTGPALLPNAFYQWSVWAIAPTGGEELLADNAPFTFRTLPIQPFYLIDPAYGEIGVAVRPTFSWQPAYGSTRYKTYVAVDHPSSPGEKLAIWESSWIPLGTQTSYYDAFSELNRGGLYYWRVYADYSSLGGRYNEGGWRPFYVTSIPQFSLRNPVNTGSIDAGPVVFSWDYPTNAEYASLVLWILDADGGLSRNPILVKDKLTQNSLSFSGPPTLTGKTTYMWQVYAWQGGNYVWASNGPFKFTTRASSAANKTIALEAILGLGQPDSSAAAGLDFNGDGILDTADLIHK